ncbi:MAG: hypothetical protein AAB268_04800 [Elusimicrobiota bacterium]
MTEKKQFNPLVLIIWGLWMLWGFGLSTVWTRLKIDVDGVITASEDSPSKGAPRYATKYTLKGPSGEQTVIAGPTDGSLERSMPVGTRIRKQKWQLDYERDGQRIKFPVLFYDLVLGVAIGVIVWGVMIWRKQRSSAGAIS